MKKYRFYLTALLLFVFAIVLYCEEEGISFSDFISQNNERTTSVKALKEFQGDFNYLPVSTTNQIVEHNNYTLSYAEFYEQAEWVAYQLTKNQITNNKYERPYFIEDPFVKTRSADWRNYKKSGYDKGHLCPAGDRSFSKEAYDETFYMSNIAPQLPKFNAGIWNRLEQKVRYWAVKYDTLYVVTGGVLTKDLKTIGTEKVAVPKYFYKILFNKKNGYYKMIAFLVPHKATSQSIYDFVVSVDSIEKLTGIDFFPALPDHIENRLEKNSDYKEWSFQ